VGIRWIVHAAPRGGIGGTLPGVDTGSADKIGRNLKRATVIAGIALIAWAAAMLFSLFLPRPSQRADDFFYDLFYNLRPETDMKGADVVLVAADQASLDRVSQRFVFGWPWPRDIWGNIASYVDKAGAKAIAYDIVFIEPSAYRNTLGDDESFADLINHMKTPVIFGATALPPENGQGLGTWEKFSPAVKNPTFGAVNVGDDKIYRGYRTTVNGLPSLAVSTLKSMDISPRFPADRPFLLHYYGPHIRNDKTQTFTYIPAYNVITAAVDGPKGEQATGITPAMFKDKVVIMCGIALGTFDLKSSPLSAEYPGPEVQATAIENLLRGDQVDVIPAWIVSIATLALSFLVSIGVIAPRKAVFKLLAPLLGLAILFGVGIVLFRANDIRFLPPFESLIAIVIATPLAFTWTYFAEDRQRRFMLKALSKVVSPEVAGQLARDPQRLTLGTKRTEVTLLFTDLANFTDLSEGMDVQQLGEFMNLYLGEMSNEVLDQDGTLDKYIGDAIMCFWNAPLPQEDHAIRACRAALRMVQRESELQDQFAAKGTKRVLTRIGINTAGAAVGFVGSDHLFNYTALGDGVNLASRLEGANKLYGTRILLSENTAKLVKHAFWLRKLDVLRVKGKKEPMSVYELRGERNGPAPETAGHEEIIQRYEQAFVAYQAKDWPRAQALLLELCKEFGEDNASMALLHRVREYALDPPESPWDGVYISKSK
jgi:adenylate cyclase